MVHIHEEDIASVEPKTLFRVSFVNVHRVKPAEEHHDGESDTRYIEKVRGIRRTPYLGASHSAEVVLERQGTKSILLVHCSLRGDERDLDVLVATQQIRHQ